MSNPLKVIFGFHAVGVRMKTAPQSVVELHVDASRRDVRMRQFMQRAQDSGMRIIPSDGLRLAKLCGSHGHQGVVARVQALPQGHSLDDHLDQLGAAQIPMLLVLDGSLEVVKKNSHGLPARIALVGVGKTLGEMSVIDGEPRFASCVALTPVQYAVLDRDALTRIIADESKVGIKILMEFLMLLNQRLRTVSSQLVQCVEQRQKRIGR